MTNYKLVRMMHDKFGIETPPEPRSLETAVMVGRFEMMLEELVELMRAHRAGDLAEEADALVDLVVFAMGTAVLMGLPWDDVFGEVMRANLAKERGVGKRRNGLDLVKPEGWTPPDVAGVLRRAAR